MTSAEVVTDYDPFTPEFQADPFAVYRWMHREAPVFYSPRWKWWALSKWEDVHAAALDPETFPSFEGIDIDATATDQSGPGFLPDIDNPRHDQLRKIVQPWFLPRKIRSHEDNIRKVVRRLAHGWDQRDEIDLAADLSWPLPMEVFFDLLGLPAADSPDRHQLERWVHELKDREPGTDQLTPKARAATAGIREYFVHLLNERRRRPQQDLVTHIVQSTIEGQPFADEHITPASEVMGLMTVLFLGGVETTAGLISTVFKLLADNPQQRSLLQKDPALIPAAIEEAIRVATPLQLAGRTAARELAIRGVTIPKGGRVVLVYGAANRDPDRFHHPDTFDITRPQLRHLGFGEGMHGCLGAPLARMEARIAAEELLPVLGNYILSRPPTRYLSTPNMHVWGNLHLAPRPRQRRSHTNNGDETR